MKAIPEEKKEVILEAAENSLTLQLTVETMQIVLNLFLAKSLQDLWSIMNSQQLVILFTVVNIPLQSHVIYVHELLGMFH